MIDSGILLFDGDCGFCTWIADKARRWLRPRADVVAWQHADLTSLAVSATECTNAIQFVKPDGNHVAAGRAAGELLRTCPQPWPLVGAIVTAPIAIGATDALYGLVARNRYRLPGSTPACQLGTRN